MMKTKPIVMLGARGVGKSSLVKQFSENVKPTRNFWYDEYTVDFKASDNQYRLNIIDPKVSYLSALFSKTQSRLIEKGYAFIVVYSQNSLRSYCKAIDICMDIYRIKGTMDVPLVLVGNKVDLDHQVDKFRLSLVGYMTFP